MWVEISVTAKSIAVVSVFVVYLVMSGAEGYIAINNWMTVNGDMGRTLAAVDITKFVWRNHAKPK